MAAWADAILCVEHLRGLSRKCSAVGSYSMVSPRSTGFPQRRWLPLFASNTYLGRTTTLSL